MAERYIIEEKLFAPQKRSVESVRSSHTYLLVYRKDGFDRRMRNVVAGENSHGISKRYTVVSSESRILCSDIISIDKKLERLGVKVMIGFRRFACDHVHVALKDNRF